MLATQNEFGLVLTMATIKFDVVKNHGLLSSINLCKKEAKVLSELSFY